MRKFESNAVTWFELPVANMTRARSFYETLLNAQMKEFLDEEPCFMFPAEPGGVAGSLICVGCRPRWAAEGARARHSQRNAWRIAWARNLTVKNCRLLGCCRA
jgi:hypothetical protein